MASRRRGSAEAAAAAAGEAFRTAAYLGQFPSRLPTPATAKPFLRGYYAPLNAECDAPNLQITGELPRELFGTLYRNGPNPQFAPRGPYHWFGGDGMLHAFHLENGRASYRNRWERTPKWKLEHAEGDGLSDAFGSPSSLGERPQGRRDPNMGSHQRARPEGRQVQAT